jgi:hypothetical protein
VSSPLVTEKSLALNVPQATMTAPAARRQLVQ